VIFIKSFTKSFFKGCKTKVTKTTFDRVFKNIFLFVDIIWSINYFFWSFRVEKK